MKYKVLHIASGNSGGAGIAAKRLNSALIDAGIDSHMLCLNKTGNDHNVTQIKIPVISKILAHTPIPIKQNKYKKLGQEVYSRYEAVSFPEALFDISNHPLVKKADIINLHWMGCILNYPAFFKNVRKPIVWTLHDMNPFLGIAHYQGDLKKNIQYSNIEHKVNDLKIKSYNRHDSITIVNLCKWMFDYSSKSEAFSKRKHVIIPNSIDTKTFKLQDKHLLRQVLGIPDQHPVIMFCSQTVSNPRKGFDLLLEALPNLNGKYTIVTVGNTQNLPHVDNTDIFSFENIVDERLLSMIYSASDIFVLPSREDNLPNTMLESLCCGTPVIAFSNGGMKDVIRNNENGLIVEEQNSTALASAINYMIYNIDKFNSSKISNYARDIFSPTNQAEAYNELYLSILRNS